jgi:NAD(P)-dependent dehydrogenase (short-subunit alcohol dehydrogenase family)
MTALLHGQVAFVTAAGSGIGRAGAIALAREGALVVVTDRDAALAQQVAAHIAALGGHAQGVGLDVARDADVAHAIEAVVAQHGQIDIVHSHAGVQFSGGLLEATVDDMDRSWALNVRSHFVVARAVMPHMKRRKSGSIIITSSNSGVQLDRQMIAYATTKHAVIAMTRQIAADHAQFNIRCNALCPGFVDTPFNAGFERQLGGRAGLETYVQASIPMGRWADLEEIAQGIVYLASARSGFMTGHALVLDGGESL